MSTGELAESVGVVVTDRSTVTRILHNALEHFSKHGYSGASVREITQSSEVTKPTLYYYFKNKEELYRKLAEACFNEALGILKSSARLPGTPYERVVRMIKAYAHFASDRFIVARFLHLMETSPRRDAPETGFNDFTLKTFEQFRAVLEEGLASRGLSPKAVEAMAYAVMGVFHLHVGTLLSRTSLPFDMAKVEDSLGVIIKPE